MGIVSEEDGIFYGKVAMKERELGRELTERELSMMRSGSVSGEPGRVVQARKSTLPAGAVAALIVVAAVLLGEIV